MPETLESIIKQHEDFVLTDDLKINFQHWCESNYAQTYIDNFLNKIKTIKADIDALGNIFKNGRKGLPYNITFQLPKSITNFRFKNLADLGLQYKNSPENNNVYIISGEPTCDGEYEIIFEAKYDGWINGAPMIRKHYTFLINPNPRDLWKNIPVPDNIQYKKPDSDSAYIAVQFDNDEKIRGKDLVAASVRGRSHAHEGKPRDDDFLLHYCTKNGWYIMAVADGAGSAAYSRAGSKIACEAAVDSCRQKFEAQENSVDEKINILIRQMLGAKDEKLPKQSENNKDLNTNNFLAAQPNTDRDKIPSQEKLTPSPTNHNSTVQPPTPNICDPEIAAPKPGSPKLNIPALQPDLSSMESKPAIKNCLTYRKEQEKYAENAPQKTHPQEVTPTNTHADKSGFRSKKKVNDTPSKSPSMTIDKFGQLLNSDNVQIFYDLLAGALQAAHKKIEAEATKMERPINLYATTLLLVVAKKMPKVGWILASAAIGDGAIGIIGSNPMESKLFSTPDEGEFSGQTRFLTMKDIFSDYKSLRKRIKVEMRKDFQAAIAMTDGVSDAKFETDANLNNPQKWNELWNDLKTNLDLTDDNSQCEEQLLKWLEFWSPGNHDDRTIAILY